VASDVALQILLQAKDETGPALTAVHGNLGKLGSAASVAWGALGGSAATTAIGVLSDAANAAADSQAATGRLQTAIEDTGASYGDYADKVKGALDRGHDLAFTQDQLKDSLALLTAQTGNADEAMKRQTLAMDLARGMNIDLHTASKLLGKVTDENINVFARYGIHLEKGGDAATAFAKIQDKFGGQAKKYGDETAGSIDKIKDSVHEWSVQLGDSLGPAQGIIALLPGLSAGMSGAGAVMGGLSALIKMTFIPSLIALAIPFLPLILVIGAIGLAVGLLALAWSNNWGDIQGKTQAVVNAIHDFFADFTIFALSVWKGLVLGIAGAINGVIGVINGFIQGYNDIAEKLHLPLLGKIELLTPNLDAVNAAIDVAARSRSANINVTTTYMPASFNAHPQAAGGDYMVAKPTLFLAGEAGPERATFTPIRGEGHGGGATGGGGITININGDVVGLSKTELARELNTILYRHYRLGGGQR